MASYELLGLNEATPQAVAPTASDTGVVSNLAVTTNLTLTAGTANGVVFLNGSKVQTSGSVLTYDGTTLGVSTSAGLASFRVKTTGTGATDQALLNVFNSANTGLLIGTVSTGWTAGAGLSANDTYIWTNSATALSLGVNTTEFARLTSTGLSVTGVLTPEADNTRTLGTGALRWSTVYAGTGTINTSDATEKTAVVALNAAEIAAAKDLANEIGSFQFLDSVAKKGAENARHHIGMTVQRAIEVMESHGLDPFGYAFICYDEWDAETKEVIAADGEFSREIQRQSFLETTVNYSEVEVIDGVPTMVSKTRTDKQPQVEAVAVVDENGAPVVVDGEPLMHPVPVMETVTERYNIVTVREAGSRYGFRPDQLALFILRGIVA